MDKKTETFSEISQNPEVNQLVKKYFTYETILLDSHNRLWLGLSRGGVICIDLTYYKIPVSPLVFGRSIAHF